jgi:hypothetical protein
MDILEEIEVHALVFSARERHMCISGDSMKNINKKMCRSYMEN